MLTVFFYALLAIGLAAGLFFLAVRFLPPGEQLAPVVADEPLWMLPPDRTLGADDVASVRIPVALRGYRFAETDVLLDRLAEELRKRDEVIARLGRTLVGDDATPGDHPMLPYGDARPDGGDAVEPSVALVGAADRPGRALRPPALPPAWWRAESEPVQGLIADPAGAPIVHRLDEAPTTFLPVAELAELERARDEADAPPAASRRRFGRRASAAEPEQPHEHRHRRDSGAAAPPVLGAESGSWWSRLSGAESQQSTGAAGRSG